MDPLPFTLFPDLCNFNEDVDFEYFEYFAEDDCDFDEFPLASSPVDLEGLPQYKELIPHAGLHNECLIVGGPPDARQVVAVAARVHPEAMMFSADVADITDHRRHNGVIRWDLVVPHPVGVL